MASEIYYTLDNYVSQYNSVINTLGLGVFDGLLAKKLQTNTTSLAKNSSAADAVERGQIVHSDESVKNTYEGIEGVYYVNYANIYNTLNRNIGGSSYMSSNYQVTDEGENLGQRTHIIFDASEREKPLFFSQTERDSYNNYVNYMTDIYGDLSGNEKNILAEPKGGYDVGTVRSFEINGTINPNNETDTMLGKMGSAILGNILTQRNNRRAERGFPSITNINYYDIGRTKIEESDGIESLDTSIGISSSLDLPNYGIKSEYALIEFGDYTVEYEYSARTNNYSMFDAWGELINDTISLSNSPAYNSINKSFKLSFGDDSSTLYLQTVNKTLDLSQYLIQNLKYKGGLHNSESWYTYFGKHGFSVEIDPMSNQNRYIIYTNGADEKLNGKHVEFHYDEGAITHDYATSNFGTNHSMYITEKATDSYGKDLLNVTNKAFRNNKLRTIISKFHDDFKGNEIRHATPFQSAVSTHYGMSHGRNLLKVTPTNENGYDNPYCRVWTYHHQYSRLCDTIRPFTKASSDGNCTFDNTSDPRQYNNAITKYRNTTVKKTNPFSIKNRAAYQIIESEGQDLLAQHSAINKYNGLVSITPTTPFEPDKRVKTKNCMFSIENLAWKDVDKDGYNLADDQIGPLGGRIMWFPPYGLTFSENVNANWNSVSFIGRGENIYTYTNTERSGSLSFILLIDHPSVLNEWRKETGGTGDVDDIQSTEQGILRFFAGCELLEPLTIKEEEQPKPTPAPPEVKPELHKGKFRFFVFYPNNYTGYGEEKTEGGISYLLNGIAYGLIEPGYVNEEKTTTQSANKGGTNLPEVTVAASTIKSYDLGYDILKYQYYTSKKNQSEVQYDKEALAKIVDKIQSNNRQYNDIITGFTSLDFSQLSKITGASNEDIFNTTWARIHNDNEYKGYITEYETNRKKLTTKEEKRNFDISYLQKIMATYTEKMLIKIMELNDPPFNDTFTFDPSITQTTYTPEVLQKFTYLSDYIDDCAIVSFQFGSQGKYYIVDADFLDDYINFFIKDTTNFVNYYEGYMPISYVSEGDYTKRINFTPTEFNQEAEWLGGYEMHKSDNYGVSGPYFSNLTNYDNVIKSDAKIISLSQGNYQSKVYQHNLYGVIDGNTNKTFIFSYYFPINGGATGGKGVAAQPQSSWGYRVDDERFSSKIGKYGSDNPFMQVMKHAYSLGGDGQASYASVVDNKSYALNGQGFYDHLDDIFKDFATYKSSDIPSYSMADMFGAMQPSHRNDIGIKDCINDDKVNEIKAMLAYGVKKVTIEGAASVDGGKDKVGTDQGMNLDADSNSNLANYRGLMIKDWMKEQDAFKDYGDNIWPEKIKIASQSKYDNAAKDSSYDINLLHKKITRCAIITIEYDESISQNMKDTQNQKYITSGADGSYGSYNSPYDGVSADTQTSQHSDDGASDNADANKENEQTVITDKDGNVSVRYDGEESFFSTLEVNDPLLHHKIVDKVKYFDPAFHSITPEGFGARLTFLQQCTRQGNTVGASDGGVIHTATNLAFGRPPVCVLRIGDFYNTKIIIDSLSINYENGSGIQWDMNLEGIGLMPMFAKVDINFKFLGGSDLTGPINRLQNAISFNYYANTRVYDNRSDAVEYDDEGNVKNINAWTPYSKNNTTK